MLQEASGIDQDLSNRRASDLREPVGGLAAIGDAFIIIRFCIYPAIPRFVLALDSSNVSIDSQLPPYGWPEIFASLLTPHLGLAEEAFSCTCAWFLVPLRCAAR